MKHYNYWLCIALQVIIVSNGLILLTGCLTLSAGSLILHENQTVADDLTPLSGLTILESLTLSNGLTLSDGLTFVDGLAFAKA